MTRNLLLVLATLPGLLLACSSTSTVPPPIPPDEPSCSPPTCTPLPTAAAFAFEIEPTVDGGACATSLPKVSLPEGTPAFDAILACGGNQARCGNADYRVKGGTDTTVSCSVAGPVPYDVRGHISSGGVEFDVSGSVDGTGGTVTVNGTTEDGGAFGGSCTAATRVLEPGTIYATVTCENAGGAGCVGHGTFVLENCVTM